MRRRRRLQDHAGHPDRLRAGGGGTNYSLANALGSGPADLFQAGVFGRQNIGAAYLSAALAYGWHDVTTNRTVALAGVDVVAGALPRRDVLGPLRGRLSLRNAVRRHHALRRGAGDQLQPAGLCRSRLHRRRRLFALNYAAQTTTATRTELGLRTDKSFAMQDGVLTLRGRAAWAHDYNHDRAVTAVFQALPGASFVVNGARANPDAALVSAGAEMKWLNGFSLAAHLRGRVLRQRHELCRQGRRQIQLVG